MAEKDLLVRTKGLALRVIRMYAALPKTTEAQVLGKQVSRSGTSARTTERPIGPARTLSLLPKSVTA